MSRKKAPLSPLAARKQLLLLESELNRAEMLAAARGWKLEFQRTRQHWSSLGTMAATATKLMGTFSAVRRLFSGQAAGDKKSWLSLLFEGMTTGTSLWSWLQSNRGGTHEK